MSAARVYGTLTADLGTDRRTPESQAANVLDLDGLLHVNDVDPFIAALKAWKRAVAEHATQLRARHIAKAVLLEVIANRRSA